MERKKTAWRILGGILMSIFIFSCVKPYEPQILSSANHYLVVDGIINTKAGANTQIKLSRTNNLQDRNIYNPELMAVMNIESKSGITYPLNPIDQNGNYSSANLNLDPQGQYRLNITTQNGENFQSDFVIPKISPPIDSLSWTQNQGVQIMVNTHDPSNATRYYRWQYINTWEYHAQLGSAWGIDHGIIFGRPANDQRYICYNTTYSNQILLDNSLSLSQDRIRNELIQSIPQNDSILNYRLSVLVQQYALNAQAYSYWQIIQRNTQDIGSLFSLQPSELNGNIHSLTHPSNPVIGFLSAGTIEEKRIFISFDNLKSWVRNPGTLFCQVNTVPQLPPNGFNSLENYPDTTFGPYYFVTFGPLFIAKKFCLDCELNGGTNVKPTFW